MGSEFTYPKMGSQNGFDTHSPLGPPGRHPAGGVGASPVPHRGAERRAAAARHRRHPDGAGRPHLQDPGAGSRAPGAGEAGGGSLLFPPSGVLGVLGPQEKWVSQKDQKCRRSGVRAKRGPPPVCVCVCRVPDLPWNQPCNQEPRPTKLPDCTRSRA